MQKLSEEFTGKNGGFHSPVHKPALFEKKVFSADTDFLQITLTGFCAHDIRMTVWTGSRDYAFELWPVLIFEGFETES